MEVITRNVLLGIVFSLFIGINGLLIGQFINPLLFEGSVNESGFIQTSPYSAKGSFYTIDLDYHENYTSNFDFYYVKIKYPVYSDTLFTYSDDSLFGIEFDRRLLKISASSYWTINLLKSIPSPDNPTINLLTEDEIRTDHEHIAYEVDELLVNMTQNLKESFLLPNLTSQIAIQNEIFIMEVLFGNGTLLSIKQSIDNKIQITYFEHQGEVIDQEDLFTGSWVELLRYQKSSSAFAGFHLNFTNFIQSRVFPN